MGCEDNAWPSAPQASCSTTSWLAQLVGVVAVLVAQGDLVHALADLLQPRVWAAARIAVGIEERGQLLGAPEALVDGTWRSNHAPPSEAVCGASQVATSGRRYGRRWS